jgi:hypothetical protein
VSAPRYSITLNVSPVQSGRLKFGITSFLTLAIMLSSKAWCVRFLACVRGFSPVENSGDLGLDIRHHNTDLHLLGWQVFDIYFPVYFDPSHSIRLCGDAFWKRVLSA